ncbi:MAG: hypothetical protein JWQ20_3925 [Conexibacter sp.]|nr:hypothetical protein [Conexibacter sp.]
MVGDPVADIFPPDDPAARFVIVMAMARNDIERVLQDLERPGAQDAPDFSYRVRLTVGHLVEAIDALARYRETFTEVRDLISRVAPEGAAELKVVSATLQKAGKNALQDVRDNTFHYPSPDLKYSPSSDEKLREVLALMTDSGVSFHFDGDTFATTMSFADDAALDLALGRPNTTVAEALRRAEVARDGALAFRAWVDHLIAAYIDVKDLVVGDAIVTAKNSEDRTA